MSKRIDWYHDDDCPEANSCIPAASIIVTDDQQRILMIERTDNGNWAIPGGAHEVGESLPQTAIRECKEETGYEVELTGIVGTFTDPQNIVEFTSNSEVRQEFSVVYIGNVVGGSAQASDESRVVRWIEQEQMKDLQLAKSMQIRIDAWLSNSLPWLG